MSLRTVEKAITRKYKDSFINYIVKEAGKNVDAGIKAKNKFKNVGEIYQYKNKILNCYTEALDGISEEKCAYSECTGKIKENLFSIEKIIIRGESGVCITANAYIPDNGESKHPAVLVLCGHCSDGKAEKEYQRLCRYLVGAGMLVLICDAMGQGERQDYYDIKTGKNKIGLTTAEHSYNGAKCWMSGRPLNYYFLRDIKVAIDYLCKREDVDKENIGVTGHSGGGTQVSLLMLSQDSRIKAFAPATYITEYMENLKIFQAQDDEQNYYGMLKNGFDYDDIILSVAPKPVMLLSVFHDFFPIDGAIKTYAQAKKYYKIFGKQDNIEFTVDNSFHSYTENLARSCTVFMQKHLTNKTEEINYKRQNKYLKKENLDAAPNGQVAYLPYAVTVRNQIKQYFEETRAKTSDTESLKKIILNDRTVCPKQAYKIAEETSGTIKKQLYIFDSYCSQKNVFKVYESTEKNAVKTEILFLDNGTECSEKKEKEILSKVRDNIRVILVDTCNFGMLKPRVSECYGVYDRFGTMYTISHQMFFLKDSFASIRTCEIMSAIETAENMFGTTVQVAAEGKIENLCAIACYLMNRKCRFSDLADTYEKYCLSDYPDDYNIKPYIVYGITKICDLGMIKESVREA